MFIGMYRKELKRAPERTVLSPKRTMTMVLNVPLIRIIKQIKIIIIHILITIQWKSVRTNIVMKGIVYENV